MCIKAVYVQEMRVELVATVNKYFSTNYWFTRDWLRSVECWVMKIATLWLEFNGPNTHTYAHDF